MFIIDCNPKEGHYTSQQGQTHQTIQCSDEFESIHYEKGNQGSSVDPDKNKSDVSD